jgi:hypothetical protein
MEKTDRGCHRIIQLSNALEVAGLRKPFAGDELLRRVRQVLDAKLATATPIAQGPSGGAPSNSQTKYNA